MVKIGEVARQAGLTIRTLRHYDSIGLLRPSQCSASGYRLYTSREIDRLARILVLRALGLPLEEIHGVLDDPRFSLAACLRLHLERVDGEIERQRQARERLAGVLARLESSPTLSVEDHTETLEVIRMFEKYCTPDQLEELRQRRETVGRRTHSAGSAFRPADLRVIQPYPLKTNPYERSVLALIGYVLPFQ